MPTVVRSCQLSLLSSLLSGRRKKCATFEQFAYVLIKIDLKADLKIIFLAIYLFWILLDSLADGVPQLRHERLHV